MKVALFKHYQSENSSVERADGWISGCKEYIRTTDVVEVEFQPLANDQVVPHQIAVLEAAAAEIEAKAFDAVANIKARIMELRSIGHEVQP